MGSLQPAGWAARDGSLCFPQATAAVRIDPRAIEAEGFPPAMVLRQCRANGRLHEWFKEPAGIETGPGTSRLHFSFAGISLSAPEKVRYRVRLTGLDEQWRDVGGRREVYYDAVPPGRYVFEVRALNGDGVASPEAVLRVRVREHYWQSGWFIGLTSLLAVGAAAGTGWMVSRRRMKRRLTELRVTHAREGERARIARDLHDDLGASLTEVSLWAGLSAERAGEEDREALSQIALKTKALVGALDEIVWAANPREDTVRSLVDYLAGFASEFLGAAGISLRLDLAGEWPDEAMEPEIRHSVFLAAREALNNVVKHSGAREASLAMRMEDGQLVIVLSDRGRGFERSQVRQGDGLDNMHERMRALGGSCRVMALDGAGTEVKLTLPLGTMRRGGR
jgi:signal transduction histidine kinase